MGDDVINGLNGLGSAVGDIVGSGASSGGFLDALSGLGNGALNGALDVGSGVMNNIKPLTALAGLANGVMGYNSNKDAINMAKQEQNLQINAYQDQQKQRQDQQNNFDSGMQSLKIK